MNFLSYKFLTDENIDVEVLDLLRSMELDIFDIKEEERWGMSDIDILEMAYKTQRIVISQDSDFGTLIFRDGVEVYGVIYLRPGHASPDVHVETVKRIIDADLNFHTPFILVAENNEGLVKIRLRQI